MAIRRQCLLLTVLCLALSPEGQAQDTPGSLGFFVNATGSQNQDHAVQLAIPAGFGDAEFTLELWIKPDDSFPVGPVEGGTDQLQNWANDDAQPYSANWWYNGNFLLDGHNNGSGFSEGTFSLQFYGGGRVRWLFGDGSGSIPTAGLWGVGAYPASGTDSLLDGAWHHLTLVRRWSGGSSADLELWIDGALVASETTPSRTDMRQYWDNWNGFPGQQRGWFWGAEKQAAVGVLPQFEDYKGLIDDLRFWSRAKSANEIQTEFANPVTGTEPGLVGHYRFGEAQGTTTCDALNGAQCMTLVNANAGVWDSENAPLAGAGDTSPPSTPANLQGVAIAAVRVDLSWSPSTDNVGVTGYVVRRDGTTVATVAGTTLTFSDAGRAPATTYSYTVAARDLAGNESPQSASVAVTTPPSGDTQAPSVPSNLQATAVSETQIDLTWNASTDNVGVTGYRVSRDSTLVATVTATSFSDTGLQANTSYNYSITAVDAAGNASAPSPGASATTLPAPDIDAPSIPAGLQASAASSTAIDLSWSASSDNVGVTGYELRRDGAIVATVPETNYADMGLQPATAYSYTVSARDAAGNVSAPSSVAQATTLAAPDTEAPSTPANLQGIATTSSIIALTWDASTDNVGVSGYDVRRDGNFVATVPGNGFNDFGLTQNSTYSYDVVAFDAAGNRSQASAAVAVTTLPSTDTESPSTPGSLQGTAISASRIDLSWDASTDNVGVTRYVVRRDGAIVALPINTLFSDQGLSESTTYQYTVAARDDAGNESPSSPSLPVTTQSTIDTQPPSAPGGLQGLAASGSRVDLTWSASIDNVGVTGYEVTRDGSPAGSTTNTRFADTGLTRNTRYTYAVTALDAAGNRSAASASVSVTTTAADPQASSGGGAVLPELAGLFASLLLMRRRWRQRTLRF